MSKKTGNAVGIVSAKRTRWRELIKQWEGSGQTQRAFCEQRGLALTSFQWWRRQFKSSDTASKTTPVSFLPVALTDHAGGSSNASVEVDLRSGTRMRFTGEAALRAVGLLAGHIR